MAEPPRFPHEYLLPRTPRRPRRGNRPAGHERRERALSTNQSSPNSWASHPNFRSKGAIARIHIRGRVFGDRQVEIFWAFDNIVRRERSDDLRRKRYAAFSSK